MSAGMKEVHIRSVINSIIQSSRKTSSWFPTMFHLESVHRGRKKLGTTSPKQCAAPCFGERLFILVFPLPFLFGVSVSPQRSRLLGQSQSRLTFLGNNFVGS